MRKFILDETLPLKEETKLQDKQYTISKEDIDKVTDYITKELQALGTANVEKVKSDIILKLENGEISKEQAYNKINDAKKNITDDKKAQLQQFKDKKYDISTINSAKDLQDAWNTLTNQLSQQKERRGLFGRRK